MESCVYGVLCVWSLVCVESGVYGVLCVWSLVCVESGVYGDVSIVSLEWLLQSSWVCHNCLQIIRAEEKVAPPPPIAVKTSKEATGCNCSACIAKR